MQKRLHASTSDTLTDNLEVACHIRRICLGHLEEIPDLDSKDLPGTPWFRPETAIYLHKANHRKTTKFFTTTRRIKEDPSMPEDAKDILLGKALVSEYLSNRDAVSIDGGSPELDSFDPHSKTRDKIKALKPKLKVLRTEETTEVKGCHRVITVEVREKADLLPRPCELEALVIYIKDAMLGQSRVINDPLRRYDVWNVHHHFPVLLVVLYPGAKARVIVGSFDGNELEVQFTSVMEFNEKSFLVQLEDLIAWAVPFCLWDTTNIPRLAPIEEEEEEESSEPSTTMPQMTLSSPLPTSARRPSPLEKTHRHSKVTAKAVAARQRKKKQKTVTTARKSRLRKEAVTKKKLYLAAIQKRQKTKTWKNE
ncbi:hypothetical protein N7466_004290 [Penicillium verhagenii]|uniref:uncharacterized protein n=1 Tax=Penicillium verhagenii TaxID=1562060 RepID=UPI00254506B8|nr:uncharacterized protein N7466_004290 [Penicillium verhagenii]KAJ5934743.1 hypothetical protein N7466_004290 [Penicillium verhagenii]